MYNVLNDECALRTHLPSNLGHLESETKPMLTPHDRQCHFSFRQRLHCKAILDWGNEMNFVMTHAPGAGSIARSQTSLHWNRLRDEGYCYPLNKIDLIWISIHLPFHTDSHTASFHPPDARLEWRPHTSVLSPPTVLYWSRTELAHIEAVTMPYCWRIKIANSITAEWMNEWMVL